MRISNCLHRVLFRVQEDRASEIASSEKKESDLQSQIEELQSNVEAMQSRMMQQQEQTRKSEEECSRLRGDLGRFKAENKSLKERVSGMQDDEKQREMELKEIRRDTKRRLLQLLDEHEFMEWGPSQISAWIINLDAQRLKKYEDELSMKLAAKKVNGSELRVVDAGDLREWGITKREDRSFVEKEIEKLRAETGQNMKRMDLAPPAAHAFGILMNGAEPKSDEGLLDELT